MTAKRDPLVVYHGPGCMDGAGAALAAWAKFRDRAEYRPAQYGQAAPTDDELVDRDVYVLDFSFPRPELARMAEAADRLVVLDHHRTAAQDLADLPFATFDMNRSGAVLAWRHLHPDLPVPELFLYIQDRDLWRWQLNGSREVSAALSASGGGEDFRALIPLLAADAPHLVDLQRERLIQEGTAVLAYQRQQVDRAERTAAPLCLCGVQGLVANSPFLQSEIGERLALRCGTFGAVWYLDESADAYRVSLRSRGDVDVSEMARRYGGGGHKNAAGFEVRGALPWGEQ